MPENPDQAIPESNDLHRKDDNGCSQSHPSETMPPRTDNTPEDTTNHAGCSQTQGQQSQARNKLIAFFSRDNWILIFTGVVAAMAVVQGYSTCSQWKVMQDQLDTMNEANRINKDSLTLVQDTAKRQLRAYVVVSSKELENFGVGKMAHVQGIYENVGQTPVYEESWLSGINVLKYPPPKFGKNQDCGSVMNLPNSSKGFFGKFIYPDKDRETPFTSDEIKKIQDGTAAVYFHGRVCYLDIFRDVRYTDFCIYWYWNKKLGRLSDGLYCPTGNNADRHEGD